MNQLKANREGSGGVTVDHNLEGAGSPGGEVAATATPAKATLGRTNTGKVPAPKPRPAPSAPVLARQPTTPGPAPVAPVLARQPTIPAPAPASPPKVADPTPDPEPPKPAGGLRGGFAANLNSLLGGGPRGGPGGRPAGFGAPAGFMGGPKPAGFGGPAPAKDSGGTVKKPEEEAPGQLQHLTKSRAKKPQRKPPTAASLPKVEELPLAFEPLDPYADAFTPEPAKPEVFTSEPSRGSAHLNRTPLFQPQSGPAPVAADPYQFGQLDFSPQAPEPEPYRPEPEPEPAPQADPYEFGQNLDFSPQAHDPEPEPETSPEDDEEERLFQALLEEERLRMESEGLDEEPIGDGEIDPFEALLQEEQANVLRELESQQQESHVEEPAIDDEEDAFEKLLQEEQRALEQDVNFDEPHHPEPEPEPHHPEPEPEPSHHHHDSSYDTPETPNFDESDPNFDAAMDDELQRILAEGGAAEEVHQEPELTDDQLEAQLMAEVGWTDDVLDDDPELKALIEEERRLMAAAEAEPEPEPTPPPVIEQPKPTPKPEAATSAPPPAYQPKTKYRPQVQPMVFDDAPEPTPAPTPAPVVHYHEPEPVVPSYTEPEPEEPEVSVSDDPYLKFFAFKPEEAQQEETQYIDSSVGSSSDMSTFATAIGIPDLANFFEGHGIDIQTMIGWSDPVAELNMLGITQMGLVHKIIAQIKVERANTHFHITSMWDGSDLSDLGEFVLQQGQQIVTSESDVSQGLNRVLTLHSPTGQSIRFKLNFAIHRSEIAV